MPFLGANAHARLFSDETLRLGDVLGHLLRSTQLMETRAFQETRDGAFTRSEQTPFGEEVGRDEIHWWVFTRESDLAALRLESIKARDSLDRLKRASVRLKSFQATTYDALLVAFRGFAGRHDADIAALLNYIEWLYQRDPLAPCILFTYRVWGSTRRGDRWIELQDRDTESTNVREALTEIAFGLRQGAGFCAYDRAYMDIGFERYEADPEKAHLAEIPESLIASRAALSALDEFAAFLEWIRDSVRNVLLDIDKCLQQGRLQTSEAFWRDFILAAAKAPQAESQFWDFKETLTAWHASGSSKQAAKTTFAEDVASFANAEGGVLVVGVSDDRKIVGIGSGSELESRLKFAADILAERLEYPRRAYQFSQVSAPSAAGGDVVCLVVVAAKTSEAVGVGDGQGHFTYPVRRETGLARVSRLDLLGEKAHQKSDSFDFVVRLRELARKSKK